MRSPLRCMVLGGRGFMGTHLTRALLAAGHGVVSFDRPHVVALDAGSVEGGDLERIEGDFLSDEDVRRALKGVDACFHLISTTLPQSSNDDPVFDLETNLVGTVRFLARAREAGVRKIVFVSSGGTVYGVPAQVPIEESHPTDPTCSYGIGKLAIEKYLALNSRLHGMDYVVLRVANPYGELQRTHANQGAVAVFLGKALRGEPIEIWGDGTVVRDYVHITDVVDAFVKALGYGGSERIFNIGSGAGLSLNQVLDTIDAILESRCERVYRTGRSFDVPASVLSIERARKHLQWIPRVGFEDGVRRFARWLREHGEGEAPGRGLAGR